MVRKSNVIGLLLLLIGWLVVPSLVLSQSLEELIEEARRREEKMREEQPRLKEIGGLKETGEERPAVQPFITREERTFLDRRIDPTTYIVGPGDELTVYLWGQVNQELPLRVNPEGKLLIPYVGAVDVSDRTLAEAKEEIHRQVKERYDKISVTVELTNVRRFRLYVTGQVNNPGQYNAWAVDRVLDVINTKAGGLTRMASKRHIEIRRANGDTLYADLVRFLHLGDLDANPYVKMGDVIYAPAKGKTVAIIGGVKLQGAYDWKPGERLADLIELAQGLQENARLDSAEIVRYKNNGDQERLYIDLEEALAAGKGFSNPGDQNVILMPDDQIFIRTIRDWHPTRVVWIYGEVEYPGPYPIKRDSTRLADLIARAGGFKDDAFLLKSQVTRWSASHAKDPEFDRLAAMAAVQGGIEKMTDLEYAYYKTKSRELGGVMGVDFEQFVRGDSTQNIVLKHGDQISVPSKRETINVSGQVEYPGLIPIVPGQGISFYIEKAGGYLWNADKGKVRVIKGKTGLWVRPSELEMLEPGDTIFVPESPRRDWWELIKDSSAVLGQLATFVILARAIAGY